MSKSNTFVFILIMLGGVLILANSMLDFFIRMTQMSVYSMMFPFIAISLMHEFLATLGVLSGAIILVSGGALLKLKQSRSTVPLLALVLGFGAISAVSGGGFILGMILAFVGGVLGLVPITIKQSSYSKRPTGTGVNTIKNSSALSVEERAIVSLLNKSNGAIMQKNIIEKTKFSKVKVSRVLDGLESKNLIERRRVGMSNLVIISKKDKAA